MRKVTDLKFFTMSELNDWGFTFVEAKKALALPQSSQENLPASSLDLSSSSPAGAAAVEVPSAALFGSPTVRTQVDSDVLATLETNDHNSSEEDDDHDFAA